MKTFSIDATALPLIFLPVLIILLLVFSLRLYSQSKKRSELLVSFALLIGIIVSFIPYNINGAERLRFWSVPFHLSTLSVVLVHITFQYFNFTKVKKIPLISVVFGVITLVSVFLPNLIAGSIISLSFVAYGIYFFVKNRNNSLYGGFVTGALIVATGVFALLGQWLPFGGVRFLFSLLLVVLVLNETMQYFDRIVVMMKTASRNSVTDALTGLYNKRFLHKKSIQLAQSQEIGVIFADIDNFKKLNDTKGHDVGDIVLQKVGETLKTIIGTNGFACRFGGEEVVGIVVRGDAAKMAEAFRSQVEKGVGVTLSVGVAVGQGDGMTIIKKADERMYLAKNSGKNKVVTQD